jgi:hypothetical protein
MAEEALVDGFKVEDFQSERSLYLYYTLEGIDHELEIMTITPLPDDRFLLEGYANVEGVAAYVSFKGTYDRTARSAFIVVAAVSMNPQYEPVHCLLRIPNIGSSYIEGRSTIDGGWDAGTWSF